MNSEDKWLVTVVLEVNAPDAKRAEEAAERQLLDGMPDAFTVIQARKAEDDDEQDYINETAQRLDVPPERVKEALKNLEAKGLIKPVRGKPL